MYDSLPNMVATTPLSQSKSPFSTSWMRSAFGAVKEPPIETGVTLQVSSKAASEAMKFALLKQPLFNNTTTFWHRPRRVDGNFSLA